MIESLPPIVGKNPKMLILGSMPGPESLRRQQYYAHPQNAFWAFMFLLLGAEPSSDYAERRALIERSPVALWDVLATCEREGALDSGIRAAVPNDIAGLLLKHPGIGMVALNGGRAALEFKKLNIAVSSVRLPSTSPAYAAMNRERKYELWRDALAPYINGEDVE